MNNAITSCDYAKGGDSSTGEVEYRTIRRFPGYRFGSDGSIWSCWEKLRIKNRSPKLGGFIHIQTDSWKIRKEHKNHDGYKQLSMTCFDGKRRKTLASHALIAEAFHGQKPAGMQVRHLNGDGSDNRACNITWGTAKENADDKKRHGTQASAAKKLDWGKVRVIRRAKRKGVKTSVIAKRFNLTVATVNKINRQETWKPKLAEGMR